MKRHSQIKLNDLASDKLLIIGMKRERKVEKVKDMKLLDDAEQSVTDLQPAIKYNFSPPFSPCVLKTPSFLYQARIYERRRKRVQYKIGVHAPTGNSRELETYG